jgi:hypothetical protein
MPRWDQPSCFDRLEVFERASVHRQRRDIRWWIRQGQFPEHQLLPFDESFSWHTSQYDRGTPCGGQGEGGEADTVFVLEDGATLRNVIIGADQSEGVYCLGSCTLENLWFEDVCEDAISIKGDGTANISGGGAFHASDKVIQHNGCGTVNIKNFYAEDYGKVYRSCGNCSGNCARSVTMEGVTAVDGGELIGINPNMGDKASYSNNCFDTSTQCQGYVGCDKSEGECEPEKAEAC